MTHSVGVSVVNPNKLRKAESSPIFGGNLRNGSHGARDRSGEMFEDDVAVAERAAEWERFDQDLGPEAKKVLCEMVEAARSVDERRKFR